MPQPWITYLLMAMLAGVFLGATINDEWHKHHDTDHTDEHRPNIGEINAAATRAARRATRDAIARWPETETRDPRVQSLLDEVMPGMLASAMGRSAPRLVVTTDRVSPGRLDWLDDDDFHVMAGASKTAILKGLGY